MAPFNHPGGLRLSAGLNLPQGHKPVSWLQSSFLQPRQSIHHRKALMLPDQRLASGALHSTAPGTQSQRRGPSLPVQQHSDTAVGHKQSGLPQLAMAGVASCVLMGACTFPGPAAAVQPPASITAFTVAPGTSLATSDTGQPVSSLPQAPCLTTEPCAAQPAAAVAQDRKPQYEIYGQTGRLLFVEWVFNSQNDLLDLARAPVRPAAASHSPRSPQPQEANTAPTAQTQQGGQSDNQPTLALPDYTISTSLPDSPQPHAPQLAGPITAGVSSNPSTTHMEAASQASNTDLVATLPTMTTAHGLPATQAATVSFLQPASRTATRPATPPATPTPIPLAPPEPVAPSPMPPAPAEPVDPTPIPPADPAPSIDPTPMPPADPAPSVTPSNPPTSALSVLATEQEALALPQPPTQFPALPSLVTPSFQQAVAVQAVLSNGLRVVLMEDHEVPLVRGSLLMRGGTNASPADKIGLASISMAVQRAGGSIAHPGPALDLRLEELAAGVESGAGPQALSLDFYCSTEDLPEVLGLWSEVLRQPALPQDRLVLYQDQVLNNIEHRNDDASSVARRQLARLMYGPTSIYARQPSKKSVTSITVEDMKQFLEVWERPDGGLLGIVGDFEPAEMLKQLEAQLGSWAPAPGQPLAPPQLIREADLMAPAAASAGKVFVVDRPGLSQASVATSEPGVSLTDVDAYPLDLLTTTFNSFGGLLFDQIRSREGLAYSVYGAWDSPPDRPGLFVGGGETSMPGQFIIGLRRVLQQATQTAPSLESLNNARDEALNAFVFNFASKSAQLQRSLVYELLGLPADLLFQYRDGISRVTPEDVLLAAQRHLHPDQQVTVVVGDAKVVVPQLEAVGLQPLPLALEEDE